MNTNESAQHLLPFIQAADEGKAIQFRYRNRVGSVWYDKTGPTWDPSQCEYRVKPEPTYRPWTREEWEQVVKVRVKHPGHVYTVSRVTDLSVQAGPKFYTFKEALEHFTQLDGTPCGELEASQ